ncbi:exodeoxyribonuclease VII large subunit [Candidatus Saccharibacteria bacterium]|nr:exodeoxyribonuclease VII large subunit [Candidatus Saccharibacteria bacterium]
MIQPTYGVSDFVAVCNQILNVSFSPVTIVGELANFRISKNRWVYFDLKDDFSSVKFFCSVYTLPGPLEDGMVLVVTGSPNLHPRFGFSITVQSIQLQGEGTIKKAANLLEAKLEKEGLFDKNRKRTLPRLPEHVGLITSLESAAYGDFVKVVSARWGLSVFTYDVQVQGEEAARQIIGGVNYFTRTAKPPEVLVIIRGGGSADDLQAFSSEAVTRAIAGSRIPTLVAIGHERDISLSEKAADMRASTPSNAAEILVPNKIDEIKRIRHLLNLADQKVKNSLKFEITQTGHHKTQLNSLIANKVASLERALNEYRQKAELLDPTNILKRGYTIIRMAGKVVSSSKKLNEDQEINIQFKDGVKSAKII